MLFTILSDELLFHVKKKQFWFSSATFFAIAFLIMGNAGHIFGGGNVAPNAPSNIALFTIALTFFATFLAASMVATSVTRDFELDTWQVIYSYPIQWKEYLMGRFLGSLIAVLLVYTFTVPGYILAAHWMVEPSVRASFSLYHYVQPLVIFGYSNIIVLSCVLFGVAAYARKSIFAYSIAVVLWVLYSIGDAAMNSEAAEKFIFLFDMYGLNVMSLVTRYWTPNELSLQVVPFEGDLFLNRVIWLAIGFAILFTSLRQFNPYPRSSLKNKKRKSKEIQKPLNVKAVESMVTPVFGLMTSIRQIIASCKLEMRLILRSLPFQILLLFTIMNALIAAAYVDPVFGSPYLPLSVVLVKAAIDAMLIPTLIVIIYYSSELVWRERGLKIDQIVDAMPVHNFVLSATKVITMWAIVLLMVLTIAGAMIVYQLFHGTDVELELYLREIGYISLPFFWISVLAVALQVIAPNKHVGMLFAIIFVAVKLASDTFFDFPLLTVFASHPEHAISNIDDTMFYILEGLKYDAYWAALTITLMILINILWSRGTSEGTAKQVRNGLKSMGKLKASCLAASVIMFGLLGYRLYQEDYVNSPFPANEDYRHEILAEYERLMRPYENKPLPQITALDIKLDTYLESRQIHASGVVTIENETDVGFSNLIITSPFEAEVVELAVEGARITEEYSRINHVKVAFDQPFMPGEKRTIRYEYAIDNSEYPGGVFDIRLLSNGTILGDFYPTFGYNQITALSDKHVRLEYGLEENNAHRAHVHDEWSNHFSGLFPFASFIDLNLVYSVDKGQRALAPGKLISQWEKDGRSYFHFNSGGRNVNGGFAVQQGVFEVASSKIDDVDLNIYYNKAYPFHIESFMDAFKISVNYFKENFGEYLFEDYELIQKSLGIGAFAQSGQLVLGEFAGFAADFDANNDVDWGSMVIGHELGHNWWGVAVLSAKAEGGYMLQETLAMYAGLMVLEKKYDRGMAARFLRYSLKKYFEEKNAATHPELPLYRSTPETNYVHYWKGASAIYAIKELIGEETVNRVLREYYQQWKLTTKRFPTSKDLIKLILRETPDEYRQIVSDYFHRMYFHEFSVIDHSVTKQDNGKYLVRATIHTDKSENIDGETINVDEFNDPVQIILINNASDEGDIYAQTPIFEKRLWFNNTKTVIEFEVDQMPTEMVIDPYHNYVERNVTDNVVRF